MIGTSELRDERRHQEQRLQVVGLAVLQVTQASIVCLINTLALTIDGTGVGDDGNVVLSVLTRSAEAVEATFSVGGMLGFGYPSPCIGLISCLLRELQWQPPRKAHKARLYYLCMYIGSIGAESEREIDK